MNLLQSEPSENNRLGDTGATMNAFDKFSALAALVIVSGVVLAAPDKTQVKPMAVQSSQAAAATAAALTRGTVKNIDAEQGTITIQHEAIDRLGMPGMTMVFRAAHAALLEHVQVGQAIAFRAERVDGAFVVTRLQAR